MSSNRPTGIDVSKWQSVRGQDHKIQPHHVLVRGASQQGTGAHNGLLEISLP